MNIALLGDVTPEIYNYIIDKYSNVNFICANNNVTENDWSNFDAVLCVQSQNDDTDYDNWIGHPHFRFVKNNSDIMVALSNELDVLINNIELEKKFLIHYPNIDDLSKYPIYKSHLEQTYLLCKNGSHRIRKRVNSNSVSYHETLKIRVTESKCTEKESVITETEYNSLMQNKDPNKNTIVKDRYMFLFDGQYFEMDIYPFWNDKAVLELELYSENQQITFPPEIEIIKDVSDDYTYKNNYLAGLKL